MDRWTDEMPIASMTSLHFDDCYRGEERDEYRRSIHRITPQSSTRRVNRVEQLTLVGLTSTEGVALSASGLEETTPFLASPSLKPIVIVSRYVFERERECVCVWWRG